MLNIPTVNLVQRGEMSAGGIAEIGGPILIGGLCAAGANKQGYEQDGAEWTGLQTTAKARLVNWWRMHGV